MRISVRRFEDDDAPAIDRLNSRLEAADTWHRLYKEDLSANPDADLEVRPVNDSLFVAVDGDEIRGGSWLREQYFWVGGEPQRVGWMKYPVAESLIDPQFAGVPASMIFQFLRQQPRLLALGMGGHEAPFARLLAGIGWTASTIPFLLRISRPFRVLRGLRYARGRRGLGIAMDLAAWSGLGWLAHRALMTTAYRPRASSGVTSSLEASFAPWADAIWNSCREAYAVVAARDAKTLDHLYPPFFPGLNRVRVARHGSDIGWVSAQILPASRNNVSYFGDLKVGLLTDVLASPEDAADVMAMGVRHLESLGVDLVIAYFSHQAWIKAARRLRFLPGPSNFAFYMSPGAEALFTESGELGTTCHFMRHTFGEDALVADPAETNPLPTP